MNFKRAKMEKHIIWDC